MLCEDVYANYLYYIDTDYSKYGHLVTEYRIYSVIRRQRPSKRIPVSRLVLLEEYMYMELFWKRKP